MKQLTMGVFNARSAAESSIHRLVKDLRIPTEDISFLYRNADNSVQEVNVGEEDETVADGAVGGAVTGGAIGALAGIATVAGLIPVIGPIFVAGPLMVALGLGAGAVGTTAAAAVTGAAAGGIIGAFANLGVSDTRAREYEERISAGDTLVTVHSENADGVTQVLTDCGATSVESYSPTT
jgi:uncharacterized membrane protein